MGGAEAEEQVTPRQAEVRYFLSLDKEERDEYVKKMILSLAETIKKLAQEKNPINLVAKARQLLKELEDKNVEIEVPLLYAMKPQYQPVIIELLNQFEEIFKQPNVKP